MTRCAFLESRMSCGRARPPGEGNESPLQYSSLENPMDRRAWWAIVHRVTEKLDMTERLNNNKIDTGRQARKEL